MAKADIVIHSWQRVALAGKTGSGKTYAARYLLEPMRRLIVIDPKMQLIQDREWNLEPPTRQAVEALKRDQYARIVYYDPPAVDSEGFPLWDSIFDFAWAVGDVLVYIDEMYSVCKHGLMSFPLRKLYTQGRALRVGVWAATQRPARVPLEMFSESEWSLTFRLQVEKDRRTVSDNLGFEAIRQPIRDEHGFWIAYQTWPEPMYFSELDTRTTGAIERRLSETEKVA